MATTKSDKPEEQGPTDLAAAKADAPAASDPSLLQGAPGSREEAEAQAPATNPADEAGADQVQALFDDAAQKGYFGETPDDKPNDEYTLQGVTGK